MKLHFIPNNSAAHISDVNGSRRSSGRLHSTFETRARERKAGKAGVRMHSHCTVPATHVVVGGHGHGKLPSSFSPSTLPPRALNYAQSVGQINCF